MQSLAATALTSKPAPPPVEWTKTYGDATESQTAYSVWQTTDGGYALFGQSGKNGWLVRVNSNGIMQWNKSFSKSGYEQRITAGQPTSDGGYMLTGGQTINGQIQGETLMIKTDAAGNVQWAKTYGASRTDTSERGSAQQTNDGGYVFAGSGANNSALLTKIDPSGNVLWSKTYDATTRARSVQQTPDGGYILAGEKTVGSFTDGWFAKTDASGNMLWSKTYGWVDHQDWINYVRTTADGGYIMTGCFERNPAEFHFTTGFFELVKTDSVGNVQWERSFDNTGIFPGAVTAEGNSVQQTTDGGFIAIGHYGPYESWLVKIDNNRQLLWTMTFTTYGGAQSYAIQTSDRGYAVAFQTQGVTQDDGSNTVLTKIMRANPPIVSCTAIPSNPMVGQEVVFNASATTDLDNDIRNYTWNFDDGNISTTMEPAVSHSFSTPGNYNVTLTVTDGEDLVSSITKEIYARINTSISVSASSRITTAGLAVNVTGVLRDMLGQPVASKPVTLYYSLSQAREWYPITSATTNADGVFSGTWLPSGTGQFSIKAEWAGDSIYSPCQNTTNLSITLTDDDYLFFVQSNSTLTALMFDSSKLELNFTVTGPSGTFGYVNAYIPKTFVTNIADVKVYLDGNLVSCEVSSFDDSWLFHFTYPHSTHNVIIRLAAGSTPLFETPLASLALIGIIAILVAAICAGSAYYFLRVRKSAKQKNDS